MERLREEAKEAAKREAVLEGKRAQGFTPQETLKQGAELIDFALKVEGRRDWEGLGTA